MERSQEFSFNISCEQPITVDDTDEDENIGNEEFKPLTLPRTTKQSGDGGASRIPRPRHFKSTFVPIQNARNGDVTPRVKRNGTPLQELDRKWALQECEDLTTWTNELLNSQGQQLNKDLRKAMSDGFTLPRVIEIVFDRTINTLRTDVELSKEEKLEILADCLDYLNSVDCDLAAISPQELESGDLKAVLTVLAAIRDAMGQGKSKALKKHADKAKLIAQDKGYRREVCVETLGSHPLNHDIIPVASQQPDSDFIPRKVLTTFQSPLSDFNREPRTEASLKPLKSIMKGSQSLDNLDGHRSTTITLGRSKSHDRQGLGQRSSSNVSINVDSGEQEYDEEQGLPSSHQFKSHSLNTQWASSGSNNDLDANKKSAFSYLSSRGRSRHERYEQDHTRLSYQALLVRDQPSGDSNPSTPALRDSTPREPTPALRNAASTELTLAVRDTAFFKEAAPDAKNAVIFTPKEVTPRRSPNSTTHKSGSKSSKKSPDKHMDSAKSGQEEKKARRSRGSKSQTDPKANSTDTKKSRERQRRLSISSDKSVSEKPARERTPNRHKNGSGRRSSKSRKKDISSSFPVCGTDQLYTEPSRLQDNINKTPECSEPVDHSELYDKPLQSHQQLSKSRTEANFSDSHSPESLSRSDTFTVRNIASDPGSRHSDSSATTVTPPIPARRDTHPTHPEPVHSEIAAEVNANEGIVYYDTVPVRVQPSLRLPQPVSTELQTFKPVEQPGKQPTDTSTDIYADLTEAQLRRLSMPTMFEYREGTRTHKSKNGLEESMVSEQTTLDTAAMEESFYDNNPRPNTPTLPALTDNTDIESVSDVLHNKRYKRSASVSDRMLFTGEESSEVLKEVPVVNDVVAREGFETEQLEQDSARKRAMVQPAQRRSSRHRKPPRPRKADVKTETSTQGPSLEEKVAHLEEIFDKLNVWFATGGGNGGSKRSSMAESGSSQRSAGASKYSRRYKHGQMPDSRANKKRFERIESHIMTLAKSITHLSSEMKSNAAKYAEIDRLSAEVAQMKKALDSKSSSSPSSKTIVDSDPLMDKARKINKLTRFFGSEPPMMKFFLKELGYEKYASKFEKSQIGVLELPYVTERQLKSIGLPVGPRMRILDEAKDIRKEISYLVPTPGNRQWS